MVFIMAFNMAFNMAFHMAFNMAFILNAQILLGASTASSPWIS